MRHRVPRSPEGDGAAKNDAASAKAWGSALVLFDKNDEWTRKNGAKIVSIDGQPVGIGGSVDVEGGEVIEFCDDIIEKRQQEIAEAHGYELVEHSLVLYVRKKNQ